MKLIEDDLNDGVSYVESENEIAIGNLLIIYPNFKNFVSTEIKNHITALKTYFKDGEMTYDCVCTSEGVGLRDTVVGAIKYTTIRAEVSFAYFYFNEQIAHETRTKRISDETLREKVRFCFLFHSLVIKFTFGHRLGLL